MVETTVVRLAVLMVAATVVKKVENLDIRSDLSWVGYSVVKSVDTLDRSKVEN
jgi:hypothetical protein